MCSTFKCVNEDEEGNCKIVGREPSIKDGCYLEIAFRESLLNQEGMCDFNPQKECDYCNRCFVYGADVALRNGTNWAGD